MRSKDQKRIAGQPVSGKGMFIGFGIAVAAVALIFFMSGKLGADRTITVAHGQTVAYHEHATLQVVDQYGDQVTVPAGIGINSTLWHDHSLDQYGVSGLAPLHTHDSSGTIHIETTVNKTYTLKDFLNIWGFDINRVNRVTVNFQEHDASYNIGGIPLHDGTEITLHLWR